MYISCMFDFQQFSQQLQPVSSFVCLALQSFVLVSVISHKYTKDVQGDGRHLQALYLQVCEWVHCQLYIPSLCHVLLLTFVYLSIHPPIQIHLLQAMKVLSKKRLMRQAGFPRKSAAKWQMVHTAESTVSYNAPVVHGNTEYQC